MWQNLIVIAIVGAACVYLGYVLFRGLVGNGKSCGGCGTCSSKSSAGGKLVQLSSDPKPQQAPSSTKESQTVSSTR